MKETIKNLLKRINLYHPLQSSYRSFLSFLENQYYRAVYSKHRGKGFTCNFCGASYKKFVPEYPKGNICVAIEKYRVIAGYGDNVYCPNCMSKNRERLIKDVLENYCEIHNKSILHFSPEKHLYALLSIKAAVTAVDLTPGFYQNIEKKIGYADATQLKFGDESFDMIMANHILEHIPDDHKAMTEMFRVLKDNGVAILQVPYSTSLQHTVEEPLINDPARQELLFGQKDHVRIYAYQDYIHRLRRAGFIVDTLTPELLERFSQHAIQPDECVFLCHKRLPQK